MKTEGGGGTAVGAAAQSTRPHERSVLRKGLIVKVQLAAAVGNITPVCPHELFNTISKQLLKTLEFTCVNI
jgi:hypothetical protein